VATGRTIAGAAGAETVVTTSRRGTDSAGRISAATAFASCLDAWKKRGSTSARFSDVMTLANSTTLVMHSLPSLSGSTTSG
jgi:hypothetical protein